jgi:dihydrofolate reductase
MRTVVWATLTANGNYARASAAHPPTQQALEDSAAQATRAGNFIVGRRTFEGFQSDSSRPGPPTPIRRLPAPTSWSCRERGSRPRESSALLPRQKHWHTSNARATTPHSSQGGETLINAFLAQGLVDELVVNIVPALESKGLKLHLPDEQYAELTLLESRELGGGVGQRRYALNRSAA